MPWLSVEWTTCLQAEREGGCAGSSNYTGNWACFIDCERARPVTKPLSVYMVYLKGGGGGGGRLVLLSLGQSHTSSWRITKQLRSETVVMLSYFYRHCVCPNCTCVKHKVQLRHGFVLRHAILTFCQVDVADPMATYSLHIDFMCYKCLVSNFQKCWTGLYQSRPSVSHQGLLKEYVMRCCYTMCCICTNKEYTDLSPNKDVFFFFFLQNVESRNFCVGII